MSWRYHALNLRTRAWVHRDLPLRNVSLTPAISGPYQLSATISPDWPDLIGTDGLPILREWGTLIVAEHQGVIRGGGIVTSTSMEGPSLEVTCTGFTGYPAGQPLVTSLTWGGPTAGTSGVGVDPADVYRALWGHLQSLSGGNLGVVVDPAGTPYRLGAWHNARRLNDDGSLGPAAEVQDPPIPIDRVPAPGYSKPAAATGKTVYWAYALHPYDGVDVGAKLDELAKQAPMDWREEYSWTGPDKEDVRLRLRLGYPRLGRRREGLRFVEGENVDQIIGIERDGGEYANTVVARGAGEGSKQLQATVASLPADRLRRARSIDRGDATTTAVLRSLASEELGVAQHLDDVTTVVVDGSHPHAPLGSFEPGDDIFVQSRHGWRRAGLWVRVLSMSYEPDASRPTVMISCARSDSFDYAGGS
ncbi:hypothetical protein ABZ799_01275 [Nocardiopsis dassonvillei]|uniref:hypothetical protein n=1 Tax=Nocardiopsis dassonvillei TaxID=2014 RepID=UPI0033DE8513